MTRVFGVMGFPISHSLSPVMHNVALQALDLDALYAPFEVPPHHLGKVLWGLHAAGVEGLNITVPHKEHILRYLRRADVTAQAWALGAVNTLVRRGGRFVAYNTDVEGFRRALAEELCVDCRNQRVLLLGAGGAARAVGRALVSMRPRAIYVANRTATKTARLVRWLQQCSPSGTIEAVVFDREGLAELLPRIELLINATSLGLRASDPLPVDPATIHKRLVVFDLVYRAPTTSLVQTARRRGALAVDGLAMLVYQGAESFRLWWRREPPIAVMRRAVEHALRKNVHSP